MPRTGKLTKSLELLRWEAGDRVETTLEVFSRPGMVYVRPVDGGKLACLVREDEVEWDAAVAIERKSVSIQYAAATVDEMYRTHPDFISVGIADPPVKIVVFWTTEKTAKARSLCSAEGYAVEHTFTDRITGIEPVTPPARFRKLLLDEYAYWCDGESGDPESEAIRLGAMGAIANVLAALITGKGRPFSQEQAPRCGAD